MVCLYLWLYMRNDWALMSCFIRAYMFCVCGVHVCCILHASMLIIAITNCVENQHQCFDMNQSFISRNNTGESPSIWDQILKEIWRASLQFNFSGRCSSLWHVHGMQILFSSNDLYKFLHCMSQKSWSQSTWLLFNLPRDVQQTNYGQRIRHQMWWMTKYNYLQQVYTKRKRASDVFSSLIKPKLILNG